MAIGQTTARRRGASRAFSIATWFAVVLTVTACGVSGKPEFQIFGGEEAARPTINNLIDHIACEIARSMYDHLGPPSERIPTRSPHGTPEDVLWDRLLEDNFVASITLNLQVTNNEGLNPSLTFPTPFTPIATPGLTPTTPIAFTGNFTLAVNGQLNGSQYRTFTVGYLIDLVKLYFDFAPKYLVRQGELIPTCQVASVLLGGDLGLDEILSNGLHSLDRASWYNVYAAPNVLQASSATYRRSAERPLANPPTPAAPGIAAEKPTEAVALQKIDQDLQAIGNQLQSIETRMRANEKGMAATAPPVTGPSQTVYFSSTLQFSVTAGISGGPGWTLRHFTGPNGSGGGSGGGGSGGGGNGGGGGGGSTGKIGGAGGSSGAGQGFLNFNRNETDLMLFQAAATCRKTQSTLRGQDYWDSIPKCASPAGIAARNATQSIFQLRSIYAVPY